MTNCIICGDANGKFHVKGKPEISYCEECAIQFYDSVDCLESDTY